MCGFCEVENKFKDPLNLFSEEEIDRVVNDVFIGLITVNNLDYWTYQKVARKLAEGVFKGFGKEFFEVNYGTADYLMLKDLRENVYVFSGAKQYQQVREMSSLLTTGDRTRSFPEFKKEATKIFTNYNENYLQAEYNSAIAQARSASMWMEIEGAAETMPMLTYETVGDGRVRPEHAALDKISRPVNDKFWNIYFPPNDWNCRCTVMQSDAEKTSLKGFKPSEANVPEIFRFNAGKERIVYSSEHPYFSIAPKDKNWAKQNFGLPLP